MKQGKNPTVAQRRRIEQEGLDSGEWRVVKWTPTEGLLQHHLTKELKTISFSE